ncbi:tyrosine-type recombinase/integrase [Fodinicurvata halophila]|uniref:Tyrosine-type recombinase/integrase n=1 Tax=Fodinicurvata halophila TaxID=1419723 RepID=A0ABV8ULQ3_9PROT
MTDKALRSMKPGQWRTDSEVPGLVARRHARGLTFQFRYKWAGKRRTMVIGELETASALLHKPAEAYTEQPRYGAQETLERVRQGESPEELVEVILEGTTPLVTLEQAREIARELRRRLGRGQNPTESKHADWRALTLKQALEIYLDSGKERSERTTQGYRDAVERWLGDWQNRTLASLSPREVAERHKELGKRGRYAANQAMRVLRAVYNRARKLHPELPPNPCDAVEFFTEKPREAAIPPEELPQWWREVEALRNPVRRDLYKLILFTGLRRETAVRVRLEDVDLERKTLHVPKPKGGEARAFTMPLSDWLAELLRERMEDNARLLAERNKRRQRKHLPPLEASPWLFPSNSESGHISEPKPSRADGFSVEFSVHGLRHTYISAATAAGVHPYALKLLTNHALPRGDVTAGYVRADVEALRPEQERVTRQLLSWVKPDQESAKVVELEARAS